LLYQTGQIAPVCTSARRAIKARTITAREMLLRGGVDTRKPTYRPRSQNQ
jgi:hypothetical protein